MSRNTFKIGFLTISDRASRGVYEDISGPAMQEWILKAVTSPYEVVSRIIEDEQPVIKKTLIEMSDAEIKNLIINAITKKPEKHFFSSDIYNISNRQMVEIGG